MADSDKWAPGSEVDLIMPSPPPLCFGGCGQPATRYLVLPGERKDAGPYCDRCSPFPYLPLLWCAKCERPVQSTGASIGGNTIFRCPTPGCAGGAFPVRERPAGAAYVSAGRFGVTLLTDWLDALAKERGQQGVHEDAVNLMRCAAWLRKAMAAGVREDLADWLPAIAGKVVMMSPAEARA